MRKSSIEDVWLGSKYDSMNILYIYYFLEEHSYVIDFGQNVKLWKKKQPNCLAGQEIQACIRSGTSHFKWLNQQESRTGFPN